MRALHSLVLVAAALSLSGCAEEKGPLAVPVPDQMIFEAQIYPLLLRDCGFHACHGTHERFYQVFGPGHGRLRDAIGPFDPTTPEELEHSYRRAISMLDTSDLRASLLLRKPLAAGDGGAGHEGVDPLGRDVYQNKLDPNYTILEQWALTSQFAPQMLP
jgi:hypothetical protein